MEVKVNLIALVLVGFQRSEVAGFTLRAVGRVRRAGNGAGDADPNLFTLQLTDRHDIDAGQEVGRLLHGVHQGLGYRRVDGEFFRQIVNLNAAQLGDAGEVRIKFKTGFLTHNFS